MPSDENHTNSATSDAPGLAKAPFDLTSRRPDLILRSSDHVDFRVHKLVLSLASPIFADMLELPQPLQGARSEGPDSQDGLPVVVVTEDADTLDLTLRFCYPMPEPDILTVLQAGRVLETRCKYEIAAGSKAVDYALRDLIGVDSVGVYAIAVRTGTVSFAKRAAKATLEQRARDLGSPELMNINAAAFHALLDYHHRCADAVGDLATVAEYMPNDGAVWIRIGSHCCGGTSLHCATSTPLTFALWWVEYLEFIRPKLREVPHRATLSLSAAEPFLAKSDSCPTCRLRSRADLARYLETLGDRIDKAVAGVPLHI